MKRFLARVRVFFMLVSGRAKGPYAGAFKRSSEYCFCGWHLNSAARVAWDMAGKLTEVSR